MNLDSSHSFRSVSRRNAMVRFAGLALAIGAGLLATADAGETASQGVSVAYRSALPGQEAARAPKSPQTETRASGRDEILSAIEREAYIRTKLEREFLNQLKATLPRNGAGIVFGQLQLPSRLEVPLTAWDVRFEFSLPGRGIGRVLGRGTMTIKGKTLKHFTGSVLMDRQARGMQVNRIIRRGEAVGPYDLEILDTTLSQLPPDALTERVIADGARAKSELRPGAWLTGRMFEMPTLVKRRQLVTLKLINGPIEITSKGVAMQNGSAGDVIRITNARSGEEVFGRVINGDLIEVIF